ncbi:abortive infection system antitoxin AbiGi family protein [Zobellia sp. B3R18]|uniref:abortive infection system antitoxin AbiGi family protein n=1 Tax=Zobellia sp. B3R18 TaxID=2841568 RepID=UPI001C067D11|nr:abortive infection system antitoxin AbiGi family protein [Zobellia sp. B3R18]MBU2974378.1 hypothetical protein [Zobellia sp. B3R18]
MSNISSNCLFHFTPKRKFLINILEQSFVPRYCLENLKLSNVYQSEFSAAIPMTCFCDISLSQIGNHIDMYGSYGLGMTKEWGIEKKLNPVLYINPDSLISDSIRKLSDSIFLDLNRDCNEISNKIYDEYINLVCFTKSYDGPFRKSDKQYKNIRFYNEREWRYVPKLNFGGDAKFFLNSREVKDEQLVKKENQKLFKHRLCFDSNDIKYIFVKKESEIHSIIKALKKLNQRFSCEEIEILTSKIITVEQIKSDF